MSIVIGVRTDAGAATTEMEGFAKAAEHAEQAAVRTRDATGKMFKEGADGASTLSKELDNLTGHLAALAGAHELIRMVDSYTEVSNKIRVLTADQGQFNDLLNDTFEIAQSARMEWGEVAATYQRLTAATEDLHLSEQKRLTITNELSEGVKISGANTREAAMAMGEFMHAFETGALTGREFKVLMKDTPALMSELRHALGLTGEQFAEMGKHGQLSAEMIIEAFDKAAPSIHEKFGRTAPTLAEGWLLFRQELEKSIGETGIANTAFQALTLVLHSVLETVKPLIRLVTPLIKLMVELAEAAERLAKALKYMNPITAVPAIALDIADAVSGRQENAAGLTWGDAFEKFSTIPKENLKAEVDDVGRAAEEMLAKIKHPFADHALDIAAVTRLWAEGQISAEAYEKQLKKIGGVSFRDLETQLVALDEQIHKMSVQDQQGSGILGIRQAAYSAMLEAENKESLKSAKEEAALQKRIDNDRKLARQSGVTIDLAGKTAAPGYRLETSSSEEITAFHQEEEAQKRLADLAEYRKTAEFKMYEAIKKPAREYHADVLALDNLFQAHVITLREYNAEMRKVQEAYAGDEMLKILDAAAGRKPGGAEDVRGGQTEAQAYAAYKQSVDAAVDSEMRMLDVEADLRKRRADDQPSLEKAMAAQQQQIDLTRKWKAELIGLQNQRDFGKGIADGINAIGHEIDNVAGTVASKMLDAFHQINEALVDLVTTGELGLSKLAKALERDLAGSLIAQGESGLKQVIEGHTGDVTDSFRMTTAMSSGGATAAAEIAAAMATGGASAAAAIAAAMATGGAAAGVSGAAQPSLGDFIDDKNAAEAGAGDAADVVERRAPRSGGRGDPLAAVKSDAGQEAITNIVSKQHGAALATRDRLRARS